MNKLFENLSTIIKQPTSLVAIIAVAILVIAFIKVRKVTLTTRVMVQIGIVLALSTVLSFVKFSNLPYGGSTTLGSMVPIILLSLMYGPEIGFLAGLLYGVINMIIDPQIYHPIQALFDYPFAFMSLGLAGFLRSNKYIAPVLAIAGRFVFHYLSGIIFFASYAPAGQSPYLYSLVYNASYLVPELIIAMIIIALIPLDRLVKAIGISKNA